MPVWQVQDAKARLSEVIKRARTEEPQTITRHGTEQVVILSIEDFQALSRGRADFVAHLLGAQRPTISMCRAATISAGLWSCDHRLPSRHECGVGNAEGTV